MNTSSEPRRCPACSAEIPATAPQGLCPKCLLLGVASVAESSGLSGVFDPADLSQADERRPAPVSARARSSSAKTNDPRLTAPSVEELAAAFPQLEILELIGRGGMGFVYKARQPKLDRLVALKILPGHLAEEPSFHERFEREARVLAKLQHPLIVGVYDFGEAIVAERTVGWDQRRFDAPAHQYGAMISKNGDRKDDGPALEASLSHPTTAPDTRSYFYLMLEYVDGVNLREAMRAGRFTPDQALAIVPQVCEALQYAHSKGVLHRDIKPENILLDVDGRVKIADFGIAKVFDPEADAPSNSLVPGGASESELAVTRLTAPGAVLGTPLYMAPEQLISPNAVDHRADIFSLGVVFYEMLTGELPMGRFAPPSEKSLANQQIDQRIDEVVLRALAKERELRQQSAGEMKTEVETISSTPRPRPVPPPVPVAAASHRRPNSSDTAGHGIEPPVNVQQTVGPPFPSWLLTDVGRVLLALFVVSVLSGVIPLVLMIVTAPIWILDVILFQSITAGIEYLSQPWRYARDAGQFVAVALCVVVDAALLILIWRYWLCHVSPRRAGASLRWLFTPYPVEQRRSSELPNSTTTAPRTADGCFEPPANAKLTGEQNPAPISPIATDTARYAVSGNTSGSGGWWALAALFFGIPLAASPMVGFRASFDPANPPMPPSPVWVGCMITLMILFIVGGTLGPIFLGWRHLIRQHRDHSRNGILPAMIAAWFLPLLALDVMLYLGFVAPLDRYVDWQLFARYFAGLLYPVVDGVILYSTWCWVTHSPFNVPTSLKSARLWYPLGWTVLSIFVGWGAFEAVQSYGRYTFMRIDESVEMLEAKSGGYFVRGNVWSHTVARGNRTEPTPDRAYWGMAFIRQSDTKRSGSSVEVALPDLTIRRSHTVPNDVPLTEENLLAQMKLAGIDTNRLEVAAEARSLIETAHELTNTLVNHSQFPLVNLIDRDHWKVTTRPRFEGVIRHGWDVTHHTARGSLSIQVNQDDALRTVAAVVAFWLVGLALLLGLLPTRGTRLEHETGPRLADSPWPRRVSNTVNFLAGLSVVVTCIVFLPLTKRLVFPSPPPIQPPQAAISITKTAPIASRPGVAHVGHTGHEDAVQPREPTKPPQALSAAEAEAKRLGLIRVVDQQAEVYTFQQPIGLNGDAGEVLVEPHFSALVRHSVPMKDLTFTFKHTADSRQSRAFVSDYPCDYIACDWTSGTDNPRIMGYLLPPGAYDFRADAETGTLLMETDSTQRAKIAADTIKLLAEANSKSAATESDWQQGTQAAHVRFKFVPRSISKLSVPDECLVVLTEKSKSLFTRSGGYFTKHEFVTDANIHELRESIKPPAPMSDDGIFEDSPADAMIPENAPR